MRTLAYLANGTLSGAVKEGAVGLGGVSVSVPGNGFATTAANGAYTLAGIPPGTNTATYSKAGYVTETTERDDRRQCHHDQEPHARADPRHLGRHRDLEHGRAVRRHRLGAGDGSTTTAANGTYTLAGIKPGTYTATYSKPSYITVTKSVTITPGEPYPRTSRWSGPHRCP